MWQYRELIRSLTFTELRLKYQNTSLGFLWSILSPFLFATVIYLVFRNLFQQEEDFAVKLLVGIMAWRFFANGTSSGLSSIVSRSNLVTNIYIPRKIFVLSTVLANFISSILEFIILLPIIFVLTGGLPVTVLLFPLISLLFLWLIYGAGLLLGALFVYFRDLNQIWDVTLTSLFFMSPVMYPISVVPPNIMTIYMLNPLTRLIIMYREVMIVGILPSMESLIIVISSSVILFVIGNVIFNKLQRRFAEVI